MIYVLAGNLMQADSWRKSVGKNKEEVCVIRDQTDLWGVTGGIYVLTGTWSSRPDAFNIVTMMRVKGFKELDEF